MEVVPRGDRDFSNNTIGVTYLVDQGARVYIERIQIVGNERTREYVIRREFDISEGDAFNQVLIQKTKRRLEALGLFDTVDITTRPGDAPDRVVVVVRVADKASGEFAIGGGYSTAAGPLGEISFAEKNFMGRGQYLKIAGNFGEQERTFQLSFTEPYFLGYRLSAGFDVGRSEFGASSSQNYSSVNTFGSVRFGVPVTEQLNASLFYAFNGSDITIANGLLDADVFPNGTNTGDADAIQGNRKGELSNAFAGAPDEWVQSGVGYSLVYNSLNSAILPKEGIRLELTQTAYGAGGDASYLKSEIKGVGYLTLSEEFDLVGMARGRAGAVTTYGDASGYRVYENFFQGPSQIRGFAANGFGPRDPLTGDALGGMYYWNATAEVNFPAPFLPESYGIRGALFADAGQLWGLDSRSQALLAASGATGATALGNPNDNALRASIGASIIWNSPFGPLRFDYSEPVVRQSYDQLRRFNFGISTSF